ncbi:MAG: filamentous hemagglutinin N-terminal domain-containing protein, partial [Verrucomicrobiae bacterium]|nr:filamentous hemagglutinin N-terminal domain-containing protein [Verrucomicrobiae bacterium]
MKGMPLKNRLQKGILSILLPAFAMTGGPVQANPRGGVVIHGAADIANLSASQLRIHQTTRNVVINWQDFSINQGELTRFVQPKNGTALNRVVSGNISEIHGQLKGNSNVYVINPNGIVIGANGVIDVGGNAVLSTLDIDDDDFLDGGTSRFYGNSTTGVTNFGTISSSGGDVVLMGGFVDNQGQIGALNGTVAIGSGGEILLQEGAGSKITVRGSSDYTGTGVNNSGTIRGASAELKAHGNVYALAINNSGAIRATGADRSNGRVRLTASGSSSNINLGSNSMIVARSGGDGGSVEVDAGNGRVNLAGVVDAGGAENGGEVSVVGNEIVQAAGSAVVASGGTLGGKVKVDAADTMSLSGAVRSEGTFGAGGQVDLTARSILINDSAVVSANGDALGGTLRIGGDYQGRDTGLREAETVRVEDGAKLSADASSGDAGTVIVWSNGDTIFLGDVSARAKGAVGNGGLVEVSGKQNLYFDGTVGVNAANGKSGTVLFDPGDVVIGSAGGLTPPLGSPVLDSLINISAINDTLQSGANVLVVTDSGSIEIQDLGGGGTNISDASGSNRHAAIQWTNSLSSFGA